jgi:hypothetical protein
MLCPNKMLSARSDATSNVLKHLKVSCIFVFLHTGKIGAVLLQFRTCPVFES